MGRGIFTSTSGDVTVWVNEEDHIRVIAMSPGCDVGLVYGKLIEVGLYAAYWISLNQEL